MTDRRGQSTEDAAPDSLEEAAENIRRDPALNAQSGPDAATDDDARTSDTAQSGEVQGS
jgi:cell pole-organizing protein PopZ